MYIKYVFCIKQTHGGIKTTAAGIAPFRYTSYIELYRNGGEVESGKPPGVGNAD
jgi:hypothetical protein